MRYRHRPTEVEAVQWIGRNLYAIQAFGAPVRIGIGHRGEQLWLEVGKDGSGGNVPVAAGDWIVRYRGDPSDHWPVDPDDFAAKYEPVGEGS